MSRFGERPLPRISLHRRVALLGLGTALIAAAIFLPEPIRRPNNMSGTSRSSNRWPTWLWLLLVALGILGALYVGMTLTEPNKNAEKEHWYMVVGFTVTWVAVGSMLALNRNKIRTLNARLECLSPADDVDWINVGLKVLTIATVIHAVPATAAFAISYNHSSQINIANVLVLYHSIMLIMISFLVIVMLTTTPIFTRDRVDQRTSIMIGSIALGFNIILIIYLISLMILSVGSI